MNLYKVCDSTFGSNVLLPELLESAGVPEWTFEMLDRPISSVDCAWFHQWDLPDGRVWLHFGRLGPDYLLRFPYIADFVVSGDAKRVRCHPAPGIPLESVRHLFLDQVLPLVLSRPGRLVVHASAVASPRGAIAFLGPTGYGKSTLAAAFSSAGCPIMTDDCLLIEPDGDGVSAVPSYPGLRLWPETVGELFTRAPRLSPVAHYSGKRRVGADENGVAFCGERIPLARVYVLAAPDAAPPSGAPRIEPISSREAFMELVRFAFLIDIADRAALSAKFRIVGHAAARPIFRRLAYAREFSALPAVRQAILSDLSR